MDSPASSCEKYSSKVDLDSSSAASTSGWWYFCETNDTAGVRWTDTTSCQRSREAICPDLWTRN